VLEIIPSLHGALEANFNNKKQKVQAKFVWMDNNFDSAASTGAKPARVAFNLGGGVMAKQGNVEVSAAYNFNANAKKYRSHQGSVKLKLLF